MYLPPKPEPPFLTCKVDVDGMKDRGFHVTNIRAAFAQVPSNYYGFAVEVSNENGVKGVLLYIPGAPSLFNLLKERK